MVQVGDQVLERVTDGIVDLIELELEDDRSVWEPGERMLDRPRPKLKLVRLIFGQPLVGGVARAPRPCDGFRLPRRAGRLSLVNGLSR